ELPGLHGGRSRGTGPRKRRRLGSGAGAGGRAVGQHRAVPAHRRSGAGGGSAPGPPAAAAGRDPLPGPQLQVRGAVSAQSRWISPLLPHLGIHRSVPGSAAL
ncbi:hypothetical protein Q9966_000159, partial [Columba livia]